MSDEIKLAPEEQADLNEAVAAEQVFEDAKKIHEEIMGHVSAIPPLMYKLLGKDPMGPKAYCRSLSIQKLEEFCHRLGDGMMAVMHGQAAREEALSKAEKDGNIINLGKLRK